MLYHLLDTANDNAGGSLADQWPMWVIMGVIVVAFIAFMVYSGKKRKKQEREAQDIINAVKPGNKVKTIGGICGIVVEVDTEENTFVLETGTETSGKSYMKFDRQAIYQTDAKPEPQTSDVATVTDDEGFAPAENADVQEAKEETPAAEETTEAIEEEVKEETSDGQSAEKKNGNKKKSNK